jgi:hypothetical protein
MPSLSPHANTFSENSIKIFPAFFLIIDLAKWARALSYPDGYPGSLRS